MTVPIKFIADSEEFLQIAPKPILASENQPEWFKKTLQYIDDKKEIDRYGDPTSTVKLCMPFRDALTAGYHIVTPSDVWVHNDNKGNVRFQWAYEGKEIITGTDKRRYAELPIPDGFLEDAFKWLNYWTVKTPRGWSCLFTHPINYDELPFRSLTSLVDTDKFPIPVHFPFILKKDFSGLIPKGTPIIQVIPFKREKFVASYSWDEGGRLERLWKKAHLGFFNRYLKNFRIPKHFSIEEKKSKCPFGF
jgi:hypothetical protein